MTIVDWLLTKARFADSVNGFIDELADLLRAGGLPLSRLGIHIRSIHPQVAGVRILWRDDVPTDFQAYGYEIRDGGDYAASPLYPVYQRGETVRRRLHGPDVTFDFPILKDLVEEGNTDYFVTPLVFGNGDRHAASWASKAPGGFSDAQLAQIEAIGPALAAIIEIFHGRKTIANLLDTYLGREAGQRVLAGSIRRGDITAIAAALFFCDLRGFTQLSETAPRDRVIALLNDYFGCVGAAIDAQGGEILKFIGDAVLAIFPMKDDLDRDRACNAALAAAIRALEDLAAINVRRTAEGEPTIRIGIGLHAGTAAYGNIGTPGRLDFTVIGPAVNMVTRIESLCAPLGRNLLASKSFASPCGSRLRSIGPHNLKGIEAPQEIFGLPGE
jgi:adenylate cyclase